MSELFHPDTFLNAFRQQSAREMKCSMEELKFMTSWKGGAGGGIEGAKITALIGGLQLEGCTFDGTR